MLNRWQSHISITFLNKFTTDHGIPNKRFQQTSNDIFLNCTITKCYYQISLLCVLDTCISNKLQKYPAEWQSFTNHEKQQALTVGNLDCSNQRKAYISSEVYYVYLTVEPINSSPQLTHLPNWYKHHMWCPKGASPTKLYSIAGNRNTPKATKTTKNPNKP